MLHRLGAHFLVRGNLSLILGILLSIGTCVHAQSFKTSVQPLPGEDLVCECKYEMTLPDGEKKIHGLWVIYDRGPQITSFYSDPEVTKFTRRHGLGLLLAHQCNGRNAPGGPEEMDMDPKHGIGRALFTAIDQFASQSNHPELSHAKLVLLGFSGTGALFAHFGEYAPSRVIAAVLVHAAHYAPVALERVQLSDEGREVPELILAGGADKVATTQAPYDYFWRYREQGAPWTFLVQNSTGHFGVSAMKPFILTWLDDTLKERKPDAQHPLHQISEKRSWIGYMAKCSTEGRSSSTWNVCDAAIAKATSTPPKNMMSAGWLPSKHVAESWLQFARQTHP